MSILINSSNIGKGIYLTVGIIVDRWLAGKKIFENITDIR